MLTYTADDLEKIFREENINPDELQNMVVEKLTKNNLKLATAESCTGGLLSGRITAVSGASEVFDCGVCSYANKIKHKVLGVSEETLNTLGAVSPETALQMAEGVKKLANADIGASLHLPNFIFLSARLLWAKLPTTGQQAKLNTTASAELTTSLLNFLWAE